MRETQSVAFVKNEATTSRGVQQYDYIPKITAFLKNFIIFQFFIGAIHGHIPMHFFVFLCK